MRKTLIFLTSILLVIGLSNNASALLIDRGGGLIYDDDLNITWLQDANYAMTSGYDSDGRFTWSEAMNWAEQLEFVGYLDWRLMSNTDMNGINSFSDGVWDRESSEWGHLYYEELGNVQGQGIFGAHIDVDPFKNVQRGGYPWAYYWTGTIQTSTRSHLVLFEEGLSGDAPYSEEFYAWAVHNGDIGAKPIPEPATILLLGTGLLAICSKRQFK